MNEIVLDEESVRQDLFPFTLTRSVTDIRIGIFTIREKWERIFQYKIRFGNHSDESILPANIIPSPELIQSLSDGTHQKYLQSSRELKSLKYTWQIFEFNNECLKADFDAITKGRKSELISSSNKVANPSQVFIESGAKVEHAMLNAEQGPIYIGKDAEVMEGALIRGPFALCDGAVVKMGAKIYGGTIGPCCVVGGEIKNSVIFGYSNKAHDGYLGDSVIGEWCNLGAGTSNSNVKNTAGAVSIWNSSAKKFVNAGMKCGLLMGDYSRSAINTSFNTGTVVGVCCNVFGNRLTPKWIPDFSWGYDPVEKYNFEKAMRDISNWKKLKNHSLDDMEITTLKHIFEQS